MDHKSRQDKALDLMAAEKAVIDQSHYFVQTVKPHFEKFKPYLPAAVADSFGALCRAVERHSEVSK
ncbi:MAG: hypothetical protein ACRD4V_07645 [Candidatus Acidiferrales bacterium]